MYPCTHLLYTPAQTGDMLLVFSSTPALLWFKKTKKAWNKLTDKKKINAGSLYCTYPKRNFFLFLDWYSIVGLYCLKTIPANCRRYTCSFPVFLFPVQVSIETEVSPCRCILLVLLSWCLHLICTNCTSTGSFIITMQSTKCAMFFLQIAYTCVNNIWNLHTI